MSSFIKSDTHITLVFDDGDSTTIYNTDGVYASVCNAVKDKDWEMARELAQPVEVVKKAVKGIEKVTVEGGFVNYDGEPLHNTLTERMLDMHSQGYDISPMALFLENLMDNPSYRAVNELYGFLENSDLPITEDGHFLAYKRINGDFKDINSNTFDNSPGKICEMRRNAVDEDKNRTCSQGLHFCSREYLPLYGNYEEDYKVVMIKINPADVVAIPTDYNNAKGRCCKYYVVKEMAIDFDSNGNLPEEKLEGSFHDTRSGVTALMVEQLNLAEALLTDDEPNIIAVFDSPTQAMHKLDIDSSSVTKVCNEDRISAGGFAWRWAKDNPANYLIEEDLELDPDLFD